MEYRDPRTAPHFNEGAQPIPAAAAEETLVSDARADLTPAQMVEQKLATLLQNMPLPHSTQLHTAGIRRAFS
jgi:hypothetical protein